MASVISDKFTLNMSDWVFSSLAPQYLRASQEGDQIVVLSGRDIYAYISLPPGNSHVLRLDLQGGGWGDFDATGVPRTGVVTGAVMHTGHRATEYTVHSTLSNLNVPVADFLAVIGSGDPTRLMNTLFVGDDTIYGAPRDEWQYHEGDRLFGGGGADRIFGRGGNDTIYGGAGDDAINVVQEGDSVATRGEIDGGPGQDILNFDTAKAGVVVDLQSGAWNGSRFVGIEGARGGDFDDSLSGSTGDDVLEGAGGADTLQGGDGFDQINGNMGDDSVLGANGVDWVSGGKDNDVVDGGDGDDLVFGNMGDDRCYGGTGADTVRGGQADDLVFGGAGDDWLSGDRGQDTLTGGAGADTFNSFVGAGLDRITDFSGFEGDRIRLEGVGAFTVVAVDGGAEIRFGSDDRVLLVGLAPQDLRPESIFLA